MLQTEISVTTTEMTGGSPPVDIDISRGPDMLQTEISVTTTEMAGGSPPADKDICVVPDVLPTAISVKSVMTDKSSEIDTPDAVVSSMEVAGGSPPAEIDISESPDVRQRAVSVTAVVSEKWMERFVINLKVVCSDGLAPDDDPARRSSDVGSDACVIQDPIPTVVSVRTVVTEEWMDRLVRLFPGRVRWPRRSGRPCLRSISLLFLLGGGGAVADAYPLVVVESDTAQVSGLQLVKSDTARVSFFWVRSLWMWLDWALARRVSEWTRRKLC